ncbi:MAG: protein translocase subunit SecD [Deltaproteobacteria bacterium]|nr:MAG: protein translocase subunit SecD [Deltaproteobacteria bacterium]
MFKNLRWRAIFIGAVIIIAFVYLIPSLLPEVSEGEEEKGIFSAGRIRLGLDLQGGMHLVLEADTKKAVEIAAERLAEDLKRALKNEDIDFIQVAREDGSDIQLTLYNDRQLDQIQDIINSDFPILEMAPPKRGEREIAVSLKLTSNEKSFVEEFAVRQCLETIRNRIDQFGVTEPSIQRQGGERIIIQLPGIADPQRAIELIGKTAQLEFKLVDDESEILTELGEEELPEGITLSYEAIEDKTGNRASVPYLRSNREGKLKEFLEGKIPEDIEVLFGESTDPQTGSTVYRTYLLKKQTVLAGDTLKDARVRIDTQFNQPYVAIRFNSRGGKIFEEMTDVHTGERLAIVLDNTVYSAPRIKQKISGGNAIIEGNFTTDSASDLAIVLRAGALPAPVKILEKRNVGPSLGKDSIQKGLNSILIGGLLVIGFIIIYYKLSGLLADFAILLNVILILGALAAFEATLTLPGIAGIVLTIGMAVDANVLILERIREELRVGKTPRAAIDAGYSKALLTILDANITTLMAGIILFQFGTGPVKGFAVTLSIGIVSSLFSALLVTRLVYDYITTTRRVRRLSI